MSSFGILFGVARAKGETPQAAIEQSTTLRFSIGVTIMKFDQPRYLQGLI